MLGKLALLKGSFQKNLLMIIPIPLILHLLMNIIQGIGMIIDEVFYAVVKTHQRR